MLLSGNGRVKSSHLGKDTAQNPLASFMDFAGVRATMTAKGKVARSSRKGSRRLFSLARLQKRCYQQTAN